MYIVELLAGAGVTAIGAALLWHAARRNRRSVRSEPINISPGPERVPD